MVIQNLSIEPRGSVDANLRAEIRREVETEIARKVKRIRVPESIRNLGWMMEKNDPFLRLQ